MIQFRNLSGIAQRVFGVIFMLPLIAGFWFSVVLAQIIFLIISILMFRELGKMAGLSGPPLLMLQVMGMLAHLCPFLTITYSWPGGTLWVFVFGLALICKIGFSKLKVIARVGDFGFILVICVSSGSALLALPEGRILLLAFALVIASCDIAAYFVGRALGGPPLAPTISPNKTISGAIGGILAALLASVLLFSPMGVFDVDSSVLRDMVALSWTQVVIVGLVIGLLSQLGDLLESALKRLLGFKDSSKLIPGHGGALDRFDGYLLTLPAINLFFLIA